MALRAVVFDYGMVLTGPPDPAAHAQLVRISGLAPARFEELYWAFRHDYDCGALTGAEFWLKVDDEARLRLSQAQLDELNHWDVCMWTTQNPPMIAWQLALKQRGLRTAVLSNMGDAVHAGIERAYAWLSRFDVLVWSYQLRLAKPDAAIYRYTLEKLGVRPEETLFIDDRAMNVEAAIALGMRGLVFTTAEKLRADLIAAGLDRELPLP